jgi:hypothetical protein
MCSKGGEHLSISGYTGSDVQISGTFKGYNTIRFGGELNFLFQGFLFHLEILEAGWLYAANKYPLGYDMLDRGKTLFTQFVPCCFM